MARDVVPDRRLVAVGTLVVAVVVLALGTLVASYLTRSSERQQTSYEGTFGRVEVSVNDDVTVTGTDDASVRASWELSWSLARPHVAHEVDGDTLRLWVSCPRLPGRGCGSSVALSVPADAAVAVHTRGNVEITGVRGGVESSSHDGSVELAAVAGPLELDTRDGSVSGRDLTSPEVHVDTRDGDLTLDFASPPDTVRLGARDGDVDLALPAVPGEYALSVEHRGGDADIRLPSDPASPHAVEVSTRDGDVLVTASPDG